MSNQMLSYPGIPNPNYPCSKHSWYVTSSPCPYCQYNKESNKIMPANAMDLIAGSSISIISGSATIVRNKKLLLLKRKPK